MERFKLNSEKMLSKLSKRKKDIEIELEENQKIQKSYLFKRTKSSKFENTKNNNEDIEIEIKKIEQEYKKN